MRHSAPCPSQDIKKKITKCKDEKSPILDLSKTEVHVGVVGDLEMGGGGGWGIW